MALLEDREIRLPAGPAILTGNLAVPDEATGLVLFAHGSGSSRHSRRNRHVAHLFNEAGLATLLFDLLTIDEERVDARTAQFRFDIPLLAERLVHATDALRREERVADLPLGYFGASTGAAAALIAASARPAVVRAVVSRGGRVDLAGFALRKVRAPTLCIVGALDDTVRELNRRAIAQMECEVRLEIIPGATHLFEEPGTLDLAAEAAREWFTRHLVARQPAVFH